MRARITGISSLAAVSLLFPALAFAQNTIGGSAQAGGISGLIILATRILNAMVSLFVLLAVVVFFWGLITYLVNVDEQKHKGLQTMVWGIIAIFVMVSIWGLVTILQQTVGVNPGQKALIPEGITPRI